MKIDTIPVKAVMDLGLIPITQGGHDQFDPYSAMGRNTDVDLAAVEDIWGVGGEWLGPTVTRIHDIVSASANDTAAGTGARTVEIFGLDTDWNKQSETITLAGTSDVPTTLSYLHIYKMIVRSAGSGDENAGIITATAQTDATITIQIAATENESQTTIFPIRAGYTGHLKIIHASLLSDSTATTAPQLVKKVVIRLRALPDGEVWQTKFTGGLLEFGTTDLKRVYEVPLIFTEKTVIKMDANTDTDNTDVAAGFDILMIKN